jgi:arylsulfatase A-like enzyme
MLRNERTSTIRFSPWPFWLLPWVVPAAASLYLKSALLLASGYWITAASLGMTRDFGFWEKLSFFKMDIAAAMLVAIALLLIGDLLPRRFRLRFVSVVSAAVTLTLYAQLRAFRVVGQFLSFRMFWSAITWGLRAPAAYAAYLGISAALLLSVGAVGILGVLCWFLKRREQAETPLEDKARNGMLGAVSWVPILCCALPLLFAFSLPHIPSNPYNSSILVRAIRACWYEDEAVPTEEFAGLTTAGLLSRYREIDHAPNSQGDARYWGKTKDGNVLFFVLETMPARFLPPAGDMDDLPNLQQLREHSFVGLDHYTTFPRTHEAVFSLLTSWYPSGVPEMFEDRYPSMRVPGIMAVLSAQGYYTAIYSPMRGGASPDERMFEQLGVEHQIYPADAFAPPPGNLRDEWLRSRITRDLATLGFLKEDIRRCALQGRHFAAVFLPQISHLPYPDLPQEEPGQDIRERARAILRIEDGWLGQLVTLLKEEHQLDNTVIVITGDHGIRNQEEDPRLVPGMIDKYSFHVPLFIYAPKALHHTMPIPWVTSHIDVEPTVLDLLGIHEERALEEGSPIWDARLAKRTTYFFANSLFGAAGYHSNDRFYMRSDMSDAVYSSSTLHFQTDDVVSMNSPEYTRVSNQLARMAGLQQVIAAHFIPGDKIRRRVLLPSGN